MRVSEAMIRTERRTGIFPLRRIPELFEMNYSVRNGDVFINRGVHNQPIDEQTKLNFDAGVTARYVSNAIMLEVDCQRARERNQCNRSRNYS